jgi:hypothetical protein
MSLLSSVIREVVEDWNWTRKLFNWVVLEMVFELSQNSAVV